MRVNKQIKMLHMEKWIEIYSFNNYYCFEYFPDGGACVARRLLNFDVDVL